MPREIILAVDVGNSRIKFGLFDRGAHSGDQRTLAEPMEVVAVRHTEAIPWKTLLERFSPSDQSASCAVLAGVKPAAIERLLSEWPRDQLPPPRVIRDSRALPLQVRVDAPDGVGIDRLLGAVAANAIRLAKQPAIIVGAGTATTVDLLGADGAFEGGAILPGLELAARSLHEHTALLPLVPVNELSVPDLPAVGRNTPAAIRSGLLYGHIGAVKEVITRLTAALPTNERRAPSVAVASPLIIVTGGNGPLLAAHLGIPLCEERELPLRGLALVAAKARD